jgi:hypothetical protein
VNEKSRDRIKSDGRHHFRVWLILPFALARTLDSVRGVRWRVECSLGR